MNALCNFQNKHHAGCKQVKTGNPDAFLALVPRPTQVPAQTVPCRVMCFGSTLVLCTAQTRLRHALECSVGGKLVSPPTWYQSTKIPYIVTLCMRRLAPPSLDKFKLKSSFLKGI